MDTWKKIGEFTWKRGRYVVQWNGMPASYSLYLDGKRIATAETPDECKAKAR